MKTAKATVVKAEVPFPFWKHLCTLAQAQSVLTLIVKSDVIPQAKIVDVSSEEYPAVPLSYEPTSDTTIKFWAIRGNDARGNSLDESAGWLFDRLAEPIDTDGMSTHPRKVKSTVIEGAGIAHLNWV